MAIINTDNYVQIIGNLRSTLDGGSIIGPGGFILSAPPAGNVDLSQNSAVVAAIVEALTGLNTGVGWVTDTSPNKPTATLYAQGTTDITP